MRVTYLIRANPLLRLNVETDGLLADMVGDCWRTVEVCEFVRHGWQWLSGLL
jgi:hypothetical protein